VTADRPILSSTKKYNTKNLAIYDLSSFIEVTENKCTNERHPLVKSDNTNSKHQHRVTIKWRGRRIGFTFLTVSVPQQNDTL